MYGNIQIAPECATVLADKICEPPADSSDSEEKNPWFVATCKTLYPKDAGLSLHLLTHFDERSCYRYAAGDSKYQGEILRALLRSEHGGQWLNAVMDGSEAQWWKELELARGVASYISSRISPGHNSRSSLAQAPPPPRSPHR